MKSIGEKIRTRRIEMQLTQTELAQKAGITMRTVSKYETGAANPRGLNLHRLSEVLGLSEAYLTNPEIEDPSYGLEEAPYVSEVRSVYGRKAGADMQPLAKKRTRTEQPGGSTPQEDKDLFFQAVMQAYMETKKDAQERFTPKKYKKDRE